MKRIWFDEARGVIAVTGTRNVFPAQSLIAMAAADMITIAMADGETTIIADNFDRLAGLDDVPFTSPGAALAYLQAEFAKAAATAGDGLDLVGLEFRMDIESLPTLP
jgi:hypothetical protein